MVCRCALHKVRTRARIEVESRWSLVLSIFPKHACRANLGRRRQLQNIARLQPCAKLRGQVNDIICLQECSEAWQAVVADVLSIEAASWAWVGGQQLFTAWKTERYNKDDHKWRMVFPDPKDASNERRSFRKFLEAFHCLLLVTSVLIAQRVLLQSLLNSACK